DTKEILLKDFFLAYRKTALKPGEIITGLKFQLPKPMSDFKLYKHSIRKDLDISSVNLGIHVEWSDPSKNNIDEIYLAAGGVAATPLRLKQTEAYLKNNFDIEGAIQTLHQEFKPISDVRATSAYRHVLIENFVRDFFTSTRGSHE